MAQSEQRMVNKRTTQRTRPDGKVEKVTITEEKIIRDGKEIVNRTETVHDANESDWQTIESKMADDWPKDFFDRANFSSPFLTFHRYDDMFDPRRGVGHEDAAGSSGQMFDNRTSQPQRITRYEDPMASVGPMFDNFSRKERAADKHRPSHAKKLDVAEHRHQALSLHNEYRRKHGSPPLKQSQKLEDCAQEWAEHLAATCKLAHRPNCKYGENVYYGYKSNGIVTAQEAVESWYDEIKHYNFGRRTSTGTTGHFTQLVWKGSKELGIGIACNKSGQTFIVANYLPAGNVIGYYEDNVKSPH